MIAAERGYSAFVVHNRNKNNAIVWKKVPYQLTKGHLSSNPNCEGTWIRNVTPVGEVTTISSDPWDSVAQASRPGVGDISKPVPRDKFSIDQLKAQCIQKGFSGFCVYYEGTGHAYQGKVAYKKFAHPVTKGFFNSNPACEMTYFRRDWPEQDQQWEFRYECGKPDAKLEEEI